MPQNAAPVFSIIVPAYDLEKLLPRCLDSLLRQSFSDWECVMVDDGSTDGTGAVCDAYAAKDPRFRAIHKENGGVSSARNAGLEAARAENILFLDGDDAFEPFALAWLAARLAEYPGDMIAYRLRAAEEPAGSPADTACRTFTAAQRGLYMVLGCGSNVTNRVFSAGIIRQGALTFDTALARAEDLEFCSRYLPAFFAARPGACVRQFNTPLYVVYADNGAARASNQAVTAHAIAWDRQAARGYAARLMQEYAGVVLAAGGWDGLELADRLYLAHQYARRFAYAVWAAGQLGEELPAGFWGREAVGDLVAAMTRDKLYDAYYWPLRLRWKRLIRAVYQSDESESKKLYWKVFLAGDLLLGRRWNRL